MNAEFLLLTAAFQLAILYISSGQVALLVPGIVVVAIFGMFAFTRENWDTHLDMVLLMAGPGGAVMILAGFVVGTTCHTQATWSHYLTMTAAMLWSVPLCWRYARCVQEARREGFGAKLLLIDLLGMQAGMTVAHLSLALLPQTPSSLWVHHVTMLTGMLFGMMMAHYSLKTISSLRRENP